MGQRQMESNAKYQFIALDIQKKIGVEYLIGHLLPPEPELERIYGCSRATVRNAIEFLARLGYVEKGRGIGTIVKIPDLVFDQSKPISFTEEMSWRGINHHSDIKKFALIRDERIASELCVSPCSEIRQISRMRYVEGMPSIFEESYLPAIQFADLAQESIVNFGLYDTFARSAGVFKIAVNEFYQPVLSGVIESQLLQIPIDSPIIKIFRHATSNNTIIEYTEAFAHPTNYQVNISMRRG